MKQTVTNRDFHDAFKNYNRESNFSRDGLDALFEYFESLEQGTGVEMELDVIAFCCDYCEYTIEEALKEYGMDSIEELRDNTTVIDVNDETIIVQSF
jgi:hypothetical protein